MNCAEFQKVLPYIIETGGNAEEEAHLRACPVCSDLVRDLKYIAEQAKLLLPMHDPSPRVWENIQGSLEREGLLKPARARGRLLGPGGVSVRRVVAGTAVLLVVFGIALLHRGKNLDRAASREVSEGAVVSSPAGFSAQDDEQLLNAVEAHRPNLRALYASNLKQVNAYISDAQQALRQNPNNEEAHRHLMHAYDQKAMVYEMAMRSIQ
jgi:hypothetical protein